MWNEASKYHKWYFAFMVSRKNYPDRTEYTEVHHIVPRSFGGTDSHDNLVRLTVREHIVAHQILVRATSGKYKAKMRYALYRMLNGRQAAFMRLSDQEVKLIMETVRESTRERMKGRVVSVGTRKKLSRAHTGKILSETTRRKISEIKRGKPAPKPDGFGAKVSATLTGRPKTYEHMCKINHNPVKIEKTRQKHLGMKRSDLAKQRMSEARKRVLAENDGKPHNKGKCQFFNPATGETGLYLPSDAPCGWDKGNPNAKGRACYYDPATNKVKRFTPGTEPEGWIRGRP